MGIINCPRTMRTTMNMCVIRTHMMNGQAAVLATTNDGSQPISKPKGMKWVAELFIPFESSGPLVRLVRSTERPSLHLNEIDSAASRAYTSSLGPPSLLKVPGCLPAYFTLQSSPHWMVNGIVFVRPSLVVVVRCGTYNKMLYTPAL